MPSLRQIEEALRRHRVDRGRAADFVDRMLGLELGREHYEQGHAFCRGVVERGGLEALDRLWESEAMVPTPNELAAPGLWLARIDLEPTPTERDRAQNQVGLAGAGYDANIASTPRDRAGRALVDLARGDVLLGAHAAEVDRTELRERRSTRSGSAVVGAALRAVGTTVELDAVTRRRRRAPRARAGRSSRSGALRARVRCRGS